MNLNIFKGLDYEPEDAESEIFLSEIPLSLLISSIESQFTDPIEYGKTDFVQSFITKYQVTIENMTEEEEEEVQKLYEQFIRFILEAFQKYLNIGLPEIEDIAEEEQLERIHYVYRFFIINLRKNFLNAILNYLEEEKKELGEILPKKKDVSTMNLKTVVNDDDVIAIIANLGDAIDIFINEDMSVERFMTLAHGNGLNLEVDYVDQMYDNFLITGNFVEKYKKMLNDILLVEIEAKVRNKFLKRYRKKAKEN